MWMDKTGPSFSLQGIDGKLHAVLNMIDARNVASVGFYDDNSVGRAAIGIEQNRPLVLLNDASGNILWSALTPDATATTRTQSKPRVAIDSWEMSGIYTRHNSQPLDEMPTFIQRCSQVSAALEKREGDYFLRLERHSNQGADYYQYSLFDPSGAALGTGSNLALPAAVDSACKGILSDNSSKAR